MVDDSVKPTNESFELFPLSLSHNYIAIFALESIIGIIYNYNHFKTCYSFHDLICDANNKF